MKIENGNEMILNKQVETFINTVKSLQDQHESGISLKEEKALLIAAAKQFKDTIDKSTDKNTLELALSMILFFLRCRDVVELIIPILYFRPKV